MDRREAFYSDVARWLSSQKKSFAPTMIVGINGPQGCGKTTLGAALTGLLCSAGFKVVSFSIDDFYLTRKDQMALATSHPANPYLQQRGYPGTHDVKLGEQILLELKKPVGGRVVCPVYDKSAHLGAGDRAPESSWKVVKTPLDFVLFDGWMLGFEPVDDSKISDPSMKEINALLKSYDRWTRLTDAFIHLNPEKIEDVVGWRIEAEEKMKASGKPGMTREDVEAYIRKFLPAYKTYLPGLRAKAPGATPFLRVTIGADRLPLTSKSV